MDVKAILAQMTQEEKAGLLSGLDVWRLKAVERLQVPSIMMADGPHGLRKQRDQADHLGLHQSEPAVCFPTACASACSFDRALIHELAAAIGEEARAADVQVVLGPGINIKRSPLCGRNFEYFSEDPLLAGELAAAWIEGLQSRGVAASLKHFAVNNQESRRMTMDAQVDMATLREIYLRGFELAIKKAKPGTVMCSYNRINGLYSSENPWLLRQLLRDEWGYEGATVSDWGAVNDHVAGVAAGMDIEMPSVSQESDKALLKALAEGRISQQAVDQAAERVLGLIDSTSSNLPALPPFSLEQHHHLARNIARDSLVLLKNEGLLPIRAGQQVAFIGEYAHGPRYQGGGSSHINAYKLTGALEAVRSVSQVGYARGYDSQLAGTDQTLLDEALALARVSDTCVLFLGLPEAMESEGFDRQHLSLPDNQLQLVEEVCKACQQVAVVLHAGAPVTLPFLEKIDALLLAYLGGEAVGGATVDILYGAVNPSGKLAETWPLRLEDTPAYLNFPGDGHQVRYGEGRYVGYRWYDKRDVTPLFPFGYGLSYSSFAYSKLHLSPQQLAEDEEVVVKVDVTNTGPVAGKESLQLYVAPLHQPGRPVRELRGFDKLSLAPGETKTASFRLNREAFAYWEERLPGWYAPGGEYQIQIGASSRDIRLSATISLSAPEPLPLDIDMNTTIGDLLAIPKYAQQLAPLVEQAVAMLAPQGGDQAIMPPEAMQAMMQDLPLRGVKLFTAGLLPEGFLEQLIDELRQLP